MRSVAVSGKRPTVPSAKSLDYIYHGYWSSFPVNASFGRFFV